MKILVAGGSGFIGAQFLASYVRRHPEIDFINLDHLGPRAVPSRLDSVATAANYRWEDIDIRHADDLRDCVAAHCPDAVVNFARAAPSAGKVGPDAELITTHVTGATHLIEAAMRQWGPGAGCFVQVSSDDVFASGSRSAPRVGEDTPYQPCTPSAASQAVACQWLMSLHRLHGAPVKVAHCSRAYGPAQLPDAGTAAGLIQDIMATSLPDERARLVSAADQAELGRGWMHVDDLCAGVWAVLRGGRPGERYNVGVGVGVGVGPGVELSQRELALALISALEGEPRSFEGPQSDAESSPGRLLLDCSKLTRETGWSPQVSANEGLAATVRWYLEHPTWFSERRVDAARRMEPTHSSAIAV